MFFRLQKDLQESKWAFNRRRYKIVFTLLIISLLSELFGNKEKSPQPSFLNYHF